MKELLKLKRFWVAVAGVAAVVVNHFFGFTESQVLDVLVAVISAALGTSAGLTAGKQSEGTSADHPTGA